MQNSQQCLELLEKVKGLVVRGKTATLEYAWAMAELAATQDEDLGELAATKQRQIAAIITMALMGQPLPESWVDFILADSRAGVPLWLGPQSHLAAGWAAILIAETARRRTWARADRSKAAALEEIHHTFHIMGIIHLVGLHLKVERLLVNKIAHKMADIKVWEGVKCTGTFFFFHVSDYQSGHTHTVRPGFLILIGK